MLYLSFKFVHKFKFCVSPLVKRYPGDLFSCRHKYVKTLVVVNVIPFYRFTVIQHIYKQTTRIHRQ